MKEHYISQLNKNIELKGFYKRLITKADKIYHALTLISKYVTHKQTQERFITLGIDFLEMSYMLYPTYKEDHADVHEELEVLVQEVQALTQGLVIRGILNPESKTLFDQELDTYMKFTQTYVMQIDTKTDSESSIVSPLFQENFFGETLTPGTLIEEPREKKLELLSEKPVMSFTQKEPEISKGHTEEQVFYKGHTPEKKKTDAIDRMNRKTTILNFIKQNKEVAIKDIVLYIGDCSEKTIQRELNDLITESLIKKVGDRRWSRYSLI